MSPHKPSSLLVLVLALVATGCLVHAEPLDPTFSVSVGYTPLRHQGYVIYYDDGLPFYVIEGRRYYIPRDSRHYHRYVRHYRTHRDRPGYREWRGRHHPDRVYRGPRPDHRSRGPRHRGPRRYHRPR